MVSKWGPGDVASGHLWRMLQCTMVNWREGGREGGRESFATDFVLLGHLVLQSMQILVL